jgi:hypothetical protein
MIRCERSRERGMYCWQWMQRTLLSRGMPSTAGGLLRQSNTDNGTSWASHVVSSGPDWESGSGWHLAPASADVGGDMGNLRTNVVAPIAKFVPFVIL